MGHPKQDNYYILFYDNLTIYPTLLYLQRINFNLRGEISGGKFWKKKVLKLVEHFAWATVVISLMPKTWINDVISWIYIVVLTFAAEGVGVVGSGWKGQGMRVEGWRMLFLCFGFIICYRFIVFVFGIRFWSCWHFWLVLLLVMSWNDILLWRFWFIAPSWRYQDRYTNKTFYYPQ